MHNLKNELEKYTLRRFALSPSKATVRQIYEAVVHITQDILQQKRAQTVANIDKTGAKQVYYMSMEFLIGRSLKNNLYNLGLSDKMSELLCEMGIDIKTLYDMEPDAGLGNGGLGRLAACYLDALTSKGYPVTGFSIRYEFGIFKQVIIDGWQVEFPDNWLEMGGCWLTPRPDEAQTVFFDGEVEEIWGNEGLKTVHRNYNRVLAVPYDLMISGAGDTVGRLRIWGAQSLDNFDMSMFSRGEYLKSVEKEAKAEAISKVLYPADDHDTGKRLRLSQQYFFVCASLKNIVKDHVEKYGTLDNLSEKAVIHINDTHPALCIPELMRILMDEYDYSWDEAFKIASKTLAYTNHTVMSEALEQWSEPMFRLILPRIHSIIKEIDRRFCEMIYKNHPEKHGEIDKMAIISHGCVRMANLCVACCYSVNGVSALHSEIIKNDLFRDYCDIFPGKFTNVTNGIAHRRWLCQSNPTLTRLLSECIGDEFVSDARCLEKFLAFEDDRTVTDRLAEIKLENKRRLAAYIENSASITVDPLSIFDIQAKRLHEYKRQLLCALYIFTLYRRIKNEGLVIFPRTFIFAAKASAGYVMAKEIIRFICALGDTINNDTSINGMLKVVFVADYRVTLAELMIPAAEVSEQISLAGKEASGTGNMKFMMNGALTIGTLDGANVEINQQVGEEGMFLFGMTAEQVTKRRPGYSPHDIYKAVSVLGDAIDAIAGGAIGGKNFDGIVSYLKDRDPYMVLGDFEAYAAAQERVLETYQDSLLWNRISLQNIAKSGIFAADRSVKEYAKNIWRLKSLYPAPFDREQLK